MVEEEKLSTQLLVFRLQGQTMYCIQILIPSLEQKHYNICAGQQSDIINQENFAEALLDKLKLAM